MTISTILKIISTILSLTAIVGFLISLNSMDLKLFYASSLVMTLSLAFLVGGFLMSESSRGEK